MRNLNRALGVLALTIATAAAGGTPAASALQNPPLVTMTGCAFSDDTSVWKTATNGGSFGLQTYCPPSNLSYYPNGLSLGGGRATNGQYASWYTSLPAGLYISFITVSSYYARDLSATGWAGDWVLDGQRVALDNTLQGPTVNYFGQPGGHTNIGTLFGWSIQCRASTCSNNGDLIQVGSVSIAAEETIPPTITPTGLWQASGWVRGLWPVLATATGPSGVCSLSATLNGWPIGTPWNATPDRSVWDQCGTASFVAMVDTNSPDFGNGAVPLVLTDKDAAGVGGPIGHTVEIDNVAPTISLSGPTDASSAAGTQYVTATATAGPSGVQGIKCSLDNGRPLWFAAAAARIGVAGVGVHALECASENNSYDSHGQANWSSPASWTLSVREPSRSLVAFTRIADKLRCGKVRQHLLVPAHWVQVRRHGKRVWVKRPPRTVVRRVVRCHPPLVVKRVCTNGDCKKHRVLELPHVVGQSTWHGRFGRGVNVSGWLGTTAGNALGGQQVHIMTALDNGSTAFTQAATVITAANGTWSVKLPAGPSRIVVAEYGGAATIEPASSAPIHLIVPAKITIHISPRSTRWGGTITISGRVLGGYIPSGKLLRLRIGVAGVRGTVGIPSVRRNGRFRTAWTFSSGRGVVRYWFSVSTLNEADYPFAPASSRRVYVRVGPG